MRNEKQEKQWQKVRDLTARFMPQALLCKGCLKTSCEFGRKRICVVQYEYADAILKLPRLRIEDEDQTLPYNRFSYESDNYTNQPRTARQGYNEAQQDMLEAGFSVKVLPRD